MTIDWISISSKDELERLVQDAATNHFNLILKHSSRCMISSMAKNRLERKPLDHFNYYIIDVLSHRQVSNALSELSGVRHESPQCFLYGGGELVAAQSHGEIDASDLRQKSKMHSDPSA
ncbi:MAG TPA: bacillithiol system redox-active protein YtxJ [Cryomorphaceae bacterium]|nr:bacillithiol system redox-active protein YtxJ [Cryomorphaceae bacterium]